jgi:hypothetical protein
VHDKQKKAFDKKAKNKEFKEGDLIMMFDVRHHHKAYKNYYPSGLNLLLSGKCL